MSGPGDGEWRWTLVLWLLVALAFLPGILSLKRCCLLPYPPLASLITLFYPLWVVPSMGSLCSICAGLRGTTAPEKKSQISFTFFSSEVGVGVETRPIQSKIRMVMMCSFGCVAEEWKLN
ncbi:hypothetical protein E2320_005494 [Naja naja]|nr:hypothetical protein E2320_005494 [Naja naja]